MESSGKMRAEGPATAVRSSLALHVVKGVHTGAQIPLASTTMMLIGTGDDCDVILSDTGVAKHHCILSTHSDGIMVRPLGASVTVQGQPHERGIGLPLPWGACVELGEAAFEVVAQSSELDSAEGAVQELEAAPRERARPPFQRSRWVIGLVLLGAAAFELQPMILTARSHSTESAEAAGQAAVVSGERRSGTAVAQDVAEVLRLSGISGETTYDGDGAVRVRGHLGDPAHVAAIVQSRAMHEIAGLKRVLVFNLDSPDEPASLAPSSAPAAPVRDPTRIILALGGVHPCVVTADGSRYRVGAVLPQGGRLRGVVNGTVLIERDGHIVRLNVLDQGVGS